MKKVFLLLTVTLFFTSCVIESPNGSGSNLETIDLTVKSTEWVESTDMNGLNRYYSFHLSMPEITNLVTTDGSVTTNLIFPNGQTSLPYVQHFENQTNRWTRTISSKYTAGGMDIFVSNSDFANDRPATMNFRVVITW